MPDEGHRYANTVYNDEWLTHLNGWPVPVPIGPTRIERIQPSAETEWTYYSWNRRTLDAVRAAQATSEMNFKGNSS
jgi:cysteine synthase A